VILCGVPMDRRPNVFRGKDWHQFQTYLGAWTTFLPRLLGKVRSQSGWTREILGGI